jgi:hypothetical protein
LSDPIQIQKENAMSYKVVFVLNALVVAVVGAVFLFVPDRVLLFLGTIDAVKSTEWACRFFGSAMFALGMVLWFAKDADAGAQKGTGWAMFISTIIGLVVAIAATLSSTAVIRTNSWIPIIAYVFFALLYAFMLFLKPKMKE